MLFSSLTFLIYFLPLFFGVYFLLPGSWRNLFLLLASLVFYGFAEPAYILLILLESFVGYLAGLAMDKVTWRKGILWGAVLFYVGLFVYFKYTGFLLANWQAFTGQSVPLVEIVLPLGISFYTFQIISYNVDVYRRQVPVQKSLANFAAYVCMFPQLIAGPIVRYSTIEKELEERRVTLEDAFAGADRFVCGLCKKVLLANQLFAFCEGFRQAGSISIVYCWLNALAILLYTYFDFSGYTDMAIGLGRMMGFTFPENFNYPFMADSITGFWRRWHMSLTTWFKDYIYIPMGGSRVPAGRHIFNMLVIWLITGLWHGADWTFVVWGLTFFVILVIEKYVIRRTKISHVYVWIVLLLTFLLFNDPSLGQFGVDLGNMLGLSGLPFVDGLAIYALRSNLVLFVLCLAGSTPRPKEYWQKLVSAKWGAWMPCIAAVGGLVLCLAYITGGSFNPFLYFRF